MEATELKDEEKFGNRIEKSCAGVGRPGKSLRETGEKRN